mgnify:CR=1 FL=1|tara:strand:+ start:168 stop:368 length:201 start_codon:yes stop_codon:yes gene_type:complete
MTRTDEAVRVEMPPEAIAGLLAGRVCNILGQDAYDQLIDLPQDDAWFVGEFAKALAQIKRDEEEDV